MGERGGGGELWTPIVFVVAAVPGANFEIPKFSILRPIKIS